MPRSVCALIDEPTRPLSDPVPALVTVRSEFANHRPAEASMWYDSPVAGSLSGRGLNWARAGAAASRNSPVQTTDKRNARMLMVLVLICCWQLGSDSVALGRLCQNST